MSVNIVNQILKFYGDFYEKGPYKFIYLNS